MLGRNVRLAAGEVDLVCRGPDARTIIVVEVKARVRERGGPARSLMIAPEAALTEHKRRKLARLTRDLVRYNGWQDRPVRIDAVAVELEPRERDGARGWVGRWWSGYRVCAVRHHANAVAW